MNKRSFALVTCLSSIPLTTNLIKKFFAGFPSVSSELTEPKLVFGLPKYRLASAAGVKVRLWASEGVRVSVLVNVGMGVAVLVAVKVAVAVEVAVKVMVGV